MKPIKTKIIPVMFFFLFMLLNNFAFADDPLKCPWNNNDKKKICKKRHVSINPMLSFAKIFRKYISPIDGDRCKMYPSCSQYSVECFEKHGLVIGWMMTWDRLIHEADEMKRSAIIRVYGKNRFYDPVKNNDFWWYNGN